MIFEIILLALASTIRPTSLAAVSALLGRDARRRLMFAYVICGLAFTIAFGVLVVGVFHGIHVQSGSSRTKGIADIIGGLAALFFGYAMLRGAAPRPRKETAKERNWMARLDQQVTIRVAALAGPLTHIPGVFYLIALNLIVAHNVRAVRGLFAVGVYNVIWFALPIAALALCIVDPDAARKVVLMVEQWAKRNSRTIILLTSFGVGIALMVRGIVIL